jgi:hypothetical protein
MLTHKFGETMNSTFYFVPIVLFLFIIGHLTFKESSTLPKTKIGRELASFQEQREAIDPSKPTVCTMTINSEDEREIFKEYLGKDFNFIELVDEENDNWFQDSCRSNIQCDILVVSAHFGGSFFGKSRHELPAERLENFSCQTSCSGILKKPREVFLFGCNTTAGKEPDARNAEEYADVLYNEHRDVYPTRAMAELHAAFRYSPVGPKTSQRMQRVFQNSRIYGFYSTAPSGKNIRPRLHRYFKSIESNDYINHLSQFPTTDENLLWTKAMKGQYIRSIDGNKELENPICILGSEKPIYKKLSWIDGVFRSKENILSYAPNINEYLKEQEIKFGDDFEDWPSEEVSYLERLQFNKEAKNVITDLLERPIPGIVSTQFSLLNLGVRVGWFDKEKVKDISLNLLATDLKSNLTLEQKDMICSLGIQLELSIDNLTEQSWNRFTIDALACLKPSDLQIQNKITSYLDNRDRILQVSAMTFLTAIKVTDKSIHSKIAKLLDTNDYLFNSSALKFFYHNPTDDRKIHSKMIKYIKSKDESLKHYTAIAFGSAQNTSVDTQVALIRSLKKNNSYIGRAIALSLAKIKPESKRAQRVLANVLKSKGPKTRDRAAYILLKLNSYHPQTLKIIKRYDMEVYNSILMK